VTSSDDDDDEYDGADEPVVITASGDHHGNAFGDVDDGFSDEHEPHIGLVHSNGDGRSLIQFIAATGVM